MSIVGNKMNFNDDQSGNSDNKDNRLAKILEGLNEQQKDAVLTTDGPLLVLAGAGTGKTRALTSRIGYIIANGLAWPRNVLAVTFTNKAAKEMKERVEHVLGEDISSMWIGTFHSICLRVLRRHADKVGMESNFNVIDKDDQLRLLKQIMKDEGYDDKKFPPRLIASKISRWKDKAQTPEMIDANDVRPDDPSAHIYNVYQKRLQILNALDFGDLLLKCLDLFREHREVLEIYQEQFKYIHVDEYQDTNVTQYLWLRLLSEKHKNICCVGDEDQSIYGWRGAEITNILRFEKDFIGAKIIKLEQNYRSTPTIIKAAASLIENNQKRLGKNLWSEQAIVNEKKIIAHNASDGIEEASYIGEQIETLQRTESAKLSNMAILVRAGYQTREFEERFMSMAIPYKIIGGQKFYERQEVKDAVAYLRLAFQPNDSLAIERVINTPKRGLGSAALNVINQFARISEIPFLKAAENLLETEELRPAARKSLRQFIFQVNRWHDQVVTEALPAHEIAEIILDESGYIQMWKEDKNIEAAARLDNLRELTSAIREFASIREFLEHVSLVTENSEFSDVNKDQISIMTLHASKGLEFDTVFLAGWEEGLFPSGRAVDENGQSGLEEERRLAYVGLTRAKKRAYITYANRRRIHGRWQNSSPSRFLDEIDENFIEFSSSSYGSTWQGRAVSEDNSSRDNSWGMPRGISNYFKNNDKNNNDEKYNKYIGKRAFHIKFGYGKVISTDDNKAKVDFELSGVKKVHINFLKFDSEL